MFFRRTPKDQLPTASSYNNGMMRGVADGSGRGIRMEAPIRRAWRNSSTFTKGTYYSIIFNLSLMIWGYYELRRSSASIWLTCHAVQCTLLITPRGFATTEFEFSRKQIIQSDIIKVDKHHGYVRHDGGKQPDHHYSAKARKQKRKYVQGPDIDGNYDSYTMVLRPPIVNDDPDDESGQYEADLSPLNEFTYPDEDGMNRVVPMRKFNLGQTKRRTRTMKGKIDSYINLKRHQLIIKENAAVSWKGILALVFGLFLLMLTFLIGQFYEEPTTRQMGGPRQTPKRAGMNRSNVGKYH